MSVPDPNNFEGDVRVTGAGENGWTDVPLAYREGGRGMGPGRDGRGRYAAAARRAPTDVSPTTSSTSCMPSTRRRTQAHTLRLRRRASDPAAIPVGLPEGVFDR